MLSLYVRYEIVTVAIFSELMIIVASYYKKIIDYIPLHYLLTHV